MTPPSPLLWNLYENLSVLVLASVPEAIIGYFESRICLSKWSDSTKIYPSYYEDKVTLFLTFLIIGRSHQLGNGWSKRNKSENKVLVNINFRPWAKILGHLNHFERHVRLTEKQVGRGNWLLTTVRTTTFSHKQSDGIFQRKHFLNLYIELVHLTEHNFLFFLLLVQARHEDQAVVFEILHSPFHNSKTGTQNLY